MKRKRLFWPITLAFLVTLFFVCLISISAAQSNDALSKEIYVGAANEAHYNYLANVNKDELLTFVETTFLNGSDAYWDISYKSTNHKNQHSTLKVTPSLQSEYLIYCHNNIN